MAGDERRSSLRQWRAEERLLRRGLSGGRRRRERGRQDGRNGLGASAGVPTRGGWRPAAARPTPAYGRHVAGAGWSEAGAARAGERGGGAGRAVQLGQKGGGSAQQRLPPFPFFFENSFLQILSKFIWTNLKSFSPLAPKNKVVPN